MSKVRGKEMTDTPITDAEIAKSAYVVHGITVLRAAFARELERELTAAKAEIERLTRERYEYRSMLCPACGGNDHDTPCAYPSEGQPGCFRDRRMSAQNICSRALYDKAYAKGFAEARERAAEIFEGHAFCECAEKIRAMKPEERHD